MYISFLLIWLYFQRIQGEITRCPIGGLFDEDLCKQLTEDSLLNRYYIIKNDKNKNDVYDKPYIAFTDSENSLTSTSTTTAKKWIKYSLKPTTTTIKWVKNSIKSNSADKDPLSDNDNQNNIIMFGQSLILNESFDLSQIEVQFEKTISIGTDIYKLKFHNILVRLLEKSDITKLSSNQCLVFIKSYYNAASIYYFSRNYDIAYTVIKEGLVLLESVQNQLNDDESIIRDVKVWKALYLLLEKDIKYSVNIMTNNKTEPVEELSIDLNTVMYKKMFPSPVALLYRRYFLDNEIVENTIVKFVLENWAIPLQQNLKLNSIMKYENIFMYYILMCSYLGKTEYKVSNLIIAIQRPVLCLEDRLLNYEANKLALKMFKDCINEKNEWTYTNNNACKDFRNLQFHHKEMITETLPKLSNELHFMNYKENLIKNLYISLSTNDIGIDQRTLHIIVTSAINFIKIKSEEYKTINQNIKLAIKFLENYVNGQLKKLKENEKNKTIDDGQHGGNSFSDSIAKTENISFKRGSDMNNENELKEMNNYDADIYIKAVMETNYSKDYIRDKNIFIALKWLAELNGVLCNNLEVNILKYQTALKSYIDEAENFASKYKDNIYVLKSDVHLKYLIYKRKAKILFPSSRWEVSTWPGGWIPSDEHVSKLKILERPTFKDKISYMYIHNLNYQKSFADFPYINKIELNILLYRNVKKVEPDNYDKMYEFLKNAIEEVVITSEDRVRNMEAHELLSRLLMKRNRKSVQKT